MIDRSRGPVSSRRASSGGVKIARFGHLTGPVLARGLVAVLGRGLGRSLCRSQDVVSCCALTAVLCCGLATTPGCSRGGAPSDPGADAAAPADQGGEDPDQGSGDADLSGGAQDLRGGADQAASADLKAPPDLAIAPDLAWSGRATVDINATDTCVVTTNPTELFVPHGQQVRIDWRNRSGVVPVDVWLSYGGGFLDLKPGATWNEPVNHCIGPNPHDEYGDISACGKVRYRFYIHCL